MVLVVPEPEPPGETGDGDALPPGVPADAAVVLTVEAGVCCEELPLPEWPGPSYTYPSVVSPGAAGLAGAVLLPDPPGTMLPEVPEVPEPPGIPGAVGRL